MQYEITLPADHDMRIIRERVAANGHRMDDVPGLGLNDVRPATGSFRPISSHALHHDLFNRGPRHDTKIFVDIRTSS